jgi:hypothetical protein
MNGATVSPSFTAWTYSDREIAAAVAYALFNGVPMTDEEIADYLRANWFELRNDPTIRDNATFSMGFKRTKPPTASRLRHGRLYLEERNCVMPVGKKRTRAGGFATLWKSTQSITENA